MFREMRRAKQEVSRDVCVEILNNEKRAVLSVIGDDGYPYGIPVNFYYEEDENTIYLHGAQQGHKIDAIKNCDKVCFTTWDKGYIPEDDWAYYVTSVVAMGRAELVQDADLGVEKIRKMGIKYYPTKEEVDEEIKESMHHVQMIAIHIEHMTGKKVHEK